MQFKSTKTYGHEVGLSCAFRQWRADSHCRFLHGYAVAISFEFSTPALDDRNWVVDFGGLKELKARLQSFFDHKTIVAADDPALQWFKQGEELGICELVILEAGVGCERFAQLAYEIADTVIYEMGLFNKGVRVTKCEVREHGANSAIYEGVN